MRPRTFVAAQVPSRPGSCNALRIFCSCGCAGKDRSIGDLEDPHDSRQGLHVGELILEIAQDRGDAEGIIEIECRKAGVG